MSMPEMELNPFTREDLAKWRNAERQLAKLLEFLDKVEGCGIECQDYRNTIALLRERFARLRATFFPGE